MPAKKWHWNDAEDTYLRRMYERTGQQGGDSWLITDDAVLDLMREHPYDIDLRKVDSLWSWTSVAPFLRKDPSRKNRSPTTQRRSD